MNELVTEMPSGAIAPLSMADFGHSKMMAEMLARSTLTPESLRVSVDAAGKATPLQYDVIVANCFIVVNQAKRWGMDPCAVIMTVSVIDQQVVYEGKLVHGVIEAKLGVRLAYSFDLKDQGEALRVTVSATLPGETVPREIQGDVANWKTAHHAWSEPKDWERQLSYRGAREWARRHSPGLMLGVYTSDEIERRGRSEAAGPARLIAPAPPRPPVPAAARAPETSAEPAHAAAEQQPANQPDTEAAKLPATVGPPKPPKAPSGKAKPAPAEPAKVPAKLAKEPAKDITPGQEGLMATLKRSAEAIDAAKPADKAFNEGAYMTKLTVDVNSADAVKLAELMGTHRGLIEAGRLGKTSVKVATALFKKRMGDLL